MKQSISLSSVGSVGVHWDKQGNGPNPCLLLYPPNPLQQKKYEERGCHAKCKHDMRGLMIGDR